MKKENLHLAVAPELVALIYADRIAGLKDGRARFQTVEDWLRQELTELTDASYVLDEHLLDLRTRPSAQDLSSGREKDRLALLRLLHNKSPHLGDGVFRRFAPFDQKRDIFLFAPRPGSYFFQIRMNQHVRPRAQKHSRNS